jgi:hypothetical protein
MHGVANGITIPSFVEEGKRVLLVGGFISVLRPERRHSAPGEFLAPSFRSIVRDVPVEQWQLQPVDFQQSAASDSLQVAVQPGR